MSKFTKALDFIITKFWLYFCIVIFIFALFIKAEYSFADYPFFSKNTFLDIFMISIILITYIFLFYKAKWIEKHIKNSTISIVFIIIGSMFIFLVPITPFSDMEHVTNGAILFSKWDIEQILSNPYLQRVIKNLKVSIFYSIFATILPKNPICLRLVNVLFYILIAYFISKICRNLGFKYPKLIYIITCSFTPLLLYCNHIYYDLPTLLMCTLALYFYTKQNTILNMILSALCLGIGGSLRILAYIIFIAIVIDYILKNGKNLLNDKLKKLRILILFIIITFSIPKITDITVDKFFKTEGIEEDYIWNLFWMGINEYEFGFMHNEIHGERRTFDDFYELLTSRTAEQNINLFSKKIFWTWSQGTYQAQRYAFGYDVDNDLDKFEYTTPLTGILLRDDFVIRNFINIFCRAQYMALFFLMILGLVKISRNDISLYRPFIYIMFGTFLMLIFYEMKSRYILHCIISMIVLATLGLTNLQQIIDQKFLKKDAN